MLSTVYAFSGEEDADFEDRFPFLGDEIGAGRRFEGDSPGARSL
ncbi:hypothetical protein [Streptomyces collinus]